MSLVDPFVPFGCLSDLGGPGPRRVLNGRSRGGGGRPGAPITSERRCRPDVGGHRRTRGGVGVSTVSTVTPPRPETSPVSLRVDSTPLTTSEGTPVSHVHSCPRGSGRVRGRPGLVRPSGLGGFRVSVAHGERPVDTTLSWGLNRRFPWT